MRGFKISLGVKIFIAIWLLVFLVPPLRESFEVWRATKHQFFPVSRDDGGKLKALHPNDPRFAAHAILGHFMSSDNEAAKGVLLQLDALTRRFPRENWIRADRLRASTARGIVLETEMAVSAPKSVSRSYGRWLNAADFRLALSQAIEGEKREPDNAFFPWMEAAFHFALRQNDAAIAALARAGKCPRWNDYTGDEARRRLAIYGMEKRVVWEEKVAIWAAQLLPHFAAMRQAMDAAIWQGILAMRRGHHVRALQIFEAVMSASKPLQNSGGNFIGVLVGESLETQVWQRLARETGAALPMAAQERSSAAARAQYRLKLAQIFAVYARKHGRDDVAARAILDGRQEGSAALWPVSSGDFDVTFGVGARQGRVATQGAWLGAVLGFCALWCAAFWVVSAVVMAAAPHEGEAFAARACVTRCANFSFWAGVIFLGLLLAAGAGSEFLVLWNELMSDDETSIFPHRVLQSGWPWVLLGLWLLPVVWTTYRRPRTVSSLPPSPRRATGVQSVRVVLWGAAAFLTLVIFLDNAEYQKAFDETLLQWPNSALLLGLILAAVVGLEIAARRGGDSRAIFVALMAAIGSGGVAAYFAFPEWGLVMGALSIIGFVTALALWARGQSEKRSAAVENGLFFGSLARRSAGVLAVVCSALYVLVALWIWPPRAKINAALERRLQIGEVAAMREQLAAQRPSAPR